MSKKEERVKSYIEKGKVLEENKFVVSDGEKIRVRWSTFMITVSWTAMSFNKNQIGSDRFKMAEKKMLNLSNFLLRESTIRKYLIKFPQLNEDHPHYKLYRGDKSRKEHLKDIHYIPSEDRLGRLELSKQKGHMHSHMLLAVGHTSYIHIDLDNLRQIVSQMLDIPMKEVDDGKGGKRLKLGCHVNVRAVTHSPLKFYITKEDYEQIE